MVLIVSKFSMMAEFLKLSFDHIYRIMIHTHNLVKNPVFSNFRINTKATFFNTKATFTKTKPPA